MNISFHKFKMDSVVNSFDIFIKPTFNIIQCSLLYLYAIICRLTFNGECDN